MIAPTGSTLEAVRARAVVLDADGRWLGALADGIGGVRAVLLGEASHGTHEFYDCRARITRRLIERHGFSAVALEADWPDAWRVNRYVRGFHDDPDADAALSGFKRFPQWMWRNRDVVEFVEWLRGHNEALAAGVPKVGIYGIDLYSLHASIAAVLGYLDKIDPDAARRARQRYACFDRFGDDPQGYGYTTALGLSEGCEHEVVEQLLELRASAAEYARRDGRVAEDEHFFAEQNARLVRSAERYYRVMFRGGAASWNLRDTHMADTLDALINYLDRARAHRAGHTKVAVWAHNSHLGDARATQPAREGQINLGQLARERWGAADEGRGRGTAIVGFTTHHGTVTAASEWGGDAEIKRVRPSLDESYERLFHDAGVGRYLLDLRPEGPVRRVLTDERLERAIGVIYRPETERSSHYFLASMPSQFDVVIHFDTSHAVRPLDRHPAWDPSELPETYPTGV